MYCVECDFFCPASSTSVSGSYPYVIRLSCLLYVCRVDRGSVDNICYVCRILVGIHCHGFGNISYISGVCVYLSVYFANVFRFAVGCHYTDIACVILVAQVIIAVCAITMGIAVNIEYRIGQRSCYAGNHNGKSDNVFDKTLCKSHLFVGWSDRLHNEIHLFLTEGQRVGVKLCFASDR